MGRRNEGWKGTWGGAEQPTSSHVDHLLQLCPYPLGRENLAIFGDDINMVEPALPAVQGRRLIIRVMSI